MGEILLMNEVYTQDGRSQRWGEARKRLNPVLMTPFKPPDAAVPEARHS